MPPSVSTLEQRRSEIVHRIAQLGDLRSGSITSTGGRCGKLNCHCHRPDHPGHGPNLRLTYKLKGKTVTESLPTPAAVRKAENEIAEFRKFEQLHREFVEVNTKICQSRPVEQTLSSEEKKRRRRSSRRSPKK
jgi:hypothetical protein